MRSAEYHKRKKQAIKEHRIILRNLRNSGLGSRKYKIFYLSPCIIWDDTNLLIFYSLF